MTRDEAVEKAEECFRRADRVLWSFPVKPRVAAELIALGNGYLALARLADS